MSPNREFYLVDLLDIGQKLVACGALRKLVNLLVFSVTSFLLVLAAKTSEFTRFLRPPGAEFKA